MGNAKTVKKDPINWASFLGTFCHAFVQKYDGHRQILGKII